MAGPYEVYLEVGQKRTFAGALDWPGWCRSGGDEAAALQALVDYGPRYATAIGAARLKFSPPQDVSDLKVVERLQGTTTTDFGAPGVVPAYDAGPFGAEELKRSHAIFKACWQAFDQAIAAAQGKELQKGPRGGGRDLAKIICHVIASDAGYLGSIAQKFRVDEGTDYAHEFDRVRQAIAASLEVGARGEIPEKGSRGGKLWPPRYYVRRAVWHTLDHTWEIEDRIID